MKTFKLFLLAAVVVLIAAPAAFAQPDTMVVIGDDSSSVGAGSCLNSYNNCLRFCDQNTSNFTQMGCKSDCWAGYWGCCSASAFN